MIGGPSGIRDPLRFAGWTSQSKQKANRTDCGCFSDSRFLSKPLTIRVPFFLLFGFNKGTLKKKGAKGYYSGTQEFLLGDDAAKLRSLQTAGREA